MADQKLTVSEFAAKIKAKYPEYKDIDDLELSKKIIAKYPEYESVVVFEDAKKKEQPQEPFQFDVSDTPSAVPSQEVEISSETIDKDEPSFFQPAYQAADWINKNIPIWSNWASTSTAMTSGILKYTDGLLKEASLFFMPDSPIKESIKKQINEKGSDEIIDTPWEDLVKDLGEYSQDIKEKRLLNQGISKEELSKGVIGNVSEGNIGTASALLVDGMIDGMIQSAVAATTGIAPLAVSAAGEKYDEIANTPGYSSGERVLHSTAVGMVEGMIEKAFSGDINVWKKALDSDKALKGFEEELLKAVKNTPLYKDVAKQGLEEGFEEALSDTFNQMLVGLKEGKEYDWTSTAESFLIGLASGGGSYVATSGMSARGSEKRAKRRAEIIQEIEEVKAKAAAAEKSSDINTFADIEKDLTEELDEIRKEDAEFYGNFSKDDIKEVIRINQEIRKVSKKYNAAKDSESLRKKYNEEINSLRDKKQEIENKYAENPSKYIKDGKEVSRSEFVDMVNKATPEEIASGQWGVQNDEEVDQLLRSKLPQDDSKKEEGVPSPEQEAEAPVEEQPVAEPSEEEAPADRDVQEAEEEVEIDEEAVKIEESTIEDAEFRIEDLQSEIEIEKGNIKEAKQKNKEDIAAVRKSKLSKEEKAERIEELKAELQDTLDDINGNIGIYKDDIRGFKSDIRKANRRLEKLRAPKVAKRQIEDTKKIEEDLGIKPFKKTNYIDVKDLGKDERTPKRLKEKEVKQLQTMVSNFNKVLNKLGAQPIKITFAANNEQFETRYRELTGRSDGGVGKKGSFVPGKGEIVINLSKSDRTTLPHEMLHAYIASVKLNPKNISEFTRIIESDLRKGSSSDVKLANDLAAFRDEYVKRKVYGDKTKDDAEIAEEFLAQYVGVMANQAKSLPVSQQLSFIEKVRKAIVKFLGKLGIVDKSLAVKLETREAALDFINGFVNALQGRTEVTAEILDKTQPLTESPIEISSEDVQLSKEQIETEGTYIKDSDLVDVKKLFSDFKKQNGREPRVWIWMSDQLKRGTYNNEKTGVTTELEGGVGFAYDEANKSKKIAWASGLSMKTLSDRVGRADFIWFMAGSEKSSFNFSKGTTKTIIAEIEAGMSKLKGETYNGVEIKEGSYDEFAKIALDILKDDQSKKWSSVKKALEKGAKVVDHPIRTKIASDLLNAGTTVKMNLEIHKFLHETLGVPKLNEYHELIRDEFLKKNEYSNGDMSLIIKPEGVEANANVHDTYPHAILGEVVGMPNKKNYVLDVVPEESKTVISKKTGLPIENAGTPVMIKTAVGDVGAIYEGQDLNVKEQIDWQVSEYGRDEVNTAIITRNTDLQQAVQDLLEGKITNKEYQDLQKIVSPVDPIGKFFLPATNEDLEKALGKAKSKKLNAPLEDGRFVGLRLDIPAYLNGNVWAVTAHEGNGAPITYGSVASATDVKFGTNPKVAAFIAAGKNMDLVGRYRIDPLEVDGKTVYKFFDTKAGKYYAERGKDVTKNDYKAADRFVADRLEKQDKSTIGKMLGKWKNFEGKTKEERDATAIKKVEEIVKIENSYPGATRKGSPWRQIGMNPFRHSYFYDRRTGQAVVAAAEVVQVGGLVYAKDVEYADWSSDQFTVEGYKDADGVPVKFQVDTDAETKVDNENYRALEKGEIPAPLYKKTWYQKVYSALFRTQLEKEILKLQEKKEARISEAESQAREIANRIKKYADTPEALKLANEYMTADNKKDAVEAIMKLRRGEELLDSLVDARAFVDNISNKLANDPAFDSLPDDLRFEIQNNITTYLRTSYRFFNDSSFNIDKRRDAAVQAQFNELVAKEIALMSSNGMSNLDIGRYIESIRQDLTEEATQMIDSYIADLVDVKYKPSVMGAGIKMPNAPFRRKKDLPDYIKQLLGEEKNPVNRFAESAKSLSNILYKGKMINSIIDIVGENSDYILDEEPSSLKRNMYEKVSDEYSPLDGKWVHKEILDMVNQKSLYQSDKAWANAYFSILKLGRKSKVIWNITTWRKNLTGGWYFIMANGVANKDFHKDFLRRTNLMFRKTGEGKTIGVGKFKYTFEIDEETKELMRIMADKGVSGKSIDANLIGMSQAAFQFGLDGDEKAYAERAKMLFNNIANKDKWLQEKYAAVDDYTKLIIFRSEIQSYAKKLYGKEYSELNDKQKDNVHEQAAERVKQSTPTFSRLPKWYNKVAIVPIVGDFMSFRLESLRSYGMNVANAVSDIKKSQESGLSDVQKKEYLTAGLRRLAGSGAVFALKLGITKVLTNLFLGDDDEKLEEEMKLLRPEWMEGQSIIPRSIDKDGNVRVYNYSSEDPYGDVSDIFGGIDSWEAMAKDFIRPNIAASFIFNLVKGEDIYGNKIADYSDSRINNTLDILGYTAKQIVVPPTISSSYRDAWKKSELPKKDRAINLASMIAERSIIRDYKYNIVNSFVQDLRKISGTRKGYLEYDNPAKRLRQLDEIKKKYEAIVAIGIAKKNNDMIKKAKRYMKTHLPKEDEQYVFHGIIREK